MPDLLSQVHALLSGQRPLPLVFAGDPVLRRHVAPYDFSLPDELWANLLEAMRQTMHDAPGVGLAAPQIGLGIRVAVIEDPATVPPEIAAERSRYPTPPRVIVNPVYQPVAQDGAGRPAEFYEGCLSVPGYAAVVPRAPAVWLRCQDELGRDIDEVVTGWAARIVAHETDHLNGTLYLDRAITRSLSTSGNLMDQWSGIPLPVIRDALGF